MLQALLSGLFMGTSYIPFPPWALFFAFVPLWSYWQKANLKQILISGWLSQFVFSLIGFHWIYITAQEFGHMPVYLSVLTLLLYCAAGSLHVPLTGLIWWLIKTKCPLKNSTVLLLLPLIHYLCEQFWPAIFPWNMGYPWIWVNLPGYHMAEWIGFEGLSLLTLFTNMLLLQAWSLRATRQLSYKKISQAFALLALINAIGVFIKPREEPEKTLKLMAVQANIGNLEKAAAEKGGLYREFILDEYAQLTRKGLNEAKPDLIVYPETAVPISLDEHFSYHPLYQKFMDLVRETKTSFFVGAYSENPSRSHTYNSIFLINEQAQHLAQYKKTIRLAFGEYIPFGDTYPYLYELLPMVSNFGVGSGPVVMEWQQLKIAPQICYEGLHPEFVREQVLKGADILINVTNDSWFGKHFEPKQHLFMTIARAIEFRRPLVRVTNTGISMVASSTGALSDFSPLHEKWVHTFDVPYDSSSPLTIYAKFGFYLRYLILLLIFALILRPKSFS